MKPGSTDNVASSCLVNTDNIVWVQDWSVQLGKMLAVDEKKEGPKLVVMKMLDDKFVVVNGIEWEKILKIYLVQVEGVFNFA